MKNKNILDLTEQYNNYIYPKPTENLFEEWIKKNRFQICDPNYCWHRLWPEKPYSSKRLDILIAGCGSDQAAILAKCNPNHNFVGIDLSKNSLEHEKKLIRENKIENLKLYRNDFRSVKFKNKFDYIISSGVIHHLDDPGTGLKYFNQNLKDEGVIYIMVYGDKKSYATNQVKQLFKKLSLKQNQESISFVMNTVNRLNNLHPAKIFAETEIKQDLSHPSGVVDFFLHKKENFFSIKELVKLLNKNKLIIKNFANGRVKPLTKFFTDAPLHIKEKINSLSIEDKLEISQILNWNDRKIDLICCKSKNKKNSIVYNKINLEKIYTYQYHGVEYKIDGPDIKINDKINNGFFNLNFANNNFKFKEILDGKKMLSEITANFDKNEKKNFNDKIIFMIENSVLDFSYHSIADYKKYYSIKTN
jgi:SAM-dependent methyltransferase